MAKRRELPPDPAPPAWPSLADRLRERGLSVSEPSAAPPPAPVSRATDDGVPDLARNGKIVVRRERKGHGGKTVTVVDGLRLPAARLETVARLLRKALGCGSWVDDGRVVLQGDLVPGAEAWLRARGAPHVIVGN